MLVRQADTDPLRLRALYDSGAELNLVSSHAVSRAVFQPSAFQAKPQATFVNNNELSLGLPYDLTVTCHDACGIQKEVPSQQFWEADFRGYDLVLGYPWLSVADPKIRFSTSTFE